MSLHVNNKYYAHVKLRYVQFDEKEVEFRKIRRFGLYERLKNKSVAVDSNREPIFYHARNWSINLEFLLLLFGTMDFPILKLLRFDSGRRVYVGFSSHFRTICRVRGANVRIYEIPRNYGAYVRSIEHFVNTNDAVFRISNSFFRTVAHSTSICSSSSLFRCGELYSRANEQQLIE